MQVGVNSAKGRFGADLNNAILGLIHSTIHIRGIKIAICEIALLCLQNEFELISINDNVVILSKFVGL